MSQKVIHSPRLSTIRMVEETLKNAPKVYTTLAELKRLLPKQVNHNTLKEIINYLQEENKITIGIEGILWIPPLTEKQKKDLWEWTSQGFRKYKPKTDKK